MKKCVKTAAKVLSVILSANLAAAALPVYADYLSESGGKIYGYSDSGKTLRGWKTIDGKEYYFKSDGSAVTGLISLNGTVYKYSDEGVLLGAFTGWTKKSGKRIYFSEGKTLSGWQVIDDEVCYFYEDGTAASGTAVIDGNTLNFSKKGVWDGKFEIIAADEDDETDINILIARLKSDIPDNYAGASYAHCRSVSGSVITLYFKDPDSAADRIAALRKKFPLINIKKVKYSRSELENVWNEVYKNRKKYGISETYIKDDMNLVQIYVNNPDDLNEKLEKYLDSIENKDIFRVNRTETELYYEDEDDSD